MMDEHNPLGREYSADEETASVRVGVARYEKAYVAHSQTTRVLSGPVIWATGNYLPDHARKMANDWALVADALDREFNKPKETEA